MVLGMFGLQDSLIKHVLGLLLASLMEALHIKNSVVFVELLYAPQVCGCQ